MSMYDQGHRLLLRARTVDLSASGAMVHGAGPIRIGQTVSVEVLRGNARNPLRLQAEVVRIATPTEHRRRHGVAVRFLDVGTLDETILEGIIAAAKR
ncbi:MAG: PilZ domain-containing protein [Myxococcales bacterium]|nr:PilZ domain-containing protein [Myxococcales bacterium]